jgi:hypothetical protein
MDSPLIAVAVLHSGRPPARVVMEHRPGWSDRLRALSARLVAWMRQ